MKLKILNTRLLIFILLISCFGCQDDILDKYQPQDWLKGKIYTQIQSQEDLKTFINCLELTGYDIILNTSGSYTVFAPTDSAFNVFFQNHPQYNSPEDIPLEELEALVEYQIIYDAWSKKQFQSLDIYGWIDPKNKLSKPRAFKHKTILHEENKPYPAKQIGNKYKIVLPHEANISLTSFTQSNKYCPVFFNEHFNLNNLNSNDYNFYFDRPLESGTIYFGSAKFDQEIPAENGFIYKTDKVLTPLPNGEEILAKGNSEHTYTSFLNLIHQFSEFNINIDATNKQPGAKEGEEVVTLFNLNYPDLVFNIQNELTGNTSNPIFTHRDHHGLMAPNDMVFETFVNNYITRGWGSLAAMPIEIKKIIVNAYMSLSAIYPSNFTSGFINGNQDSVMLQTDNILQKTFGSNCTFIGLSEPIIPRAFISVCRPMYLSRQFTTMLYAVEATKVLSALKKPNVNYAFYLPSDMGTGMAGDSSLVFIMENIELNRYRFDYYDKGERGWKVLNINDLRKKILNQIAISPPRGIAKKEFIRNLGDNYIIVDNVENTVSGSAPSTQGVGGEHVDLKPELYSEETDNGNVYVVNSFFNFASGTNYYSLFISKYIKFFNLLSKAGLYDLSYYNYPFLLDGEFYTVFIPSVQALNDYGVDNLSKEELRKFLQFHFVRKNMIFTDGSQPSGLYPTTLRDESSTTYVTNYSQLNIRTRPDVIEILDKHGNVYLEVPENNNSTNQMIYFDPNKVSDSNWDYITTGVIHEIDKVLIRDSLQVE